MARDWRWQKASFDEAMFFVDQAELEECRRIVTHEYPGSENHDNEDLGRAAVKYEFTAYFLSDTADSDSQAFRDRLRREGPGLLMLPMFGAVQARAHRWRPTWSQQKLNYVGIAVTFIEEGSGASAAPAGLGEAMLAEQAADLPAILGGTIGALVSGQAASGYFRADVAAALITVAAAIETIRQIAVLPDAISRETQAALADAVRVLGAGPATSPATIAQILFGQLDTIVTENDPSAQTALAASSGDALVTALESAAQVALASARIVTPGVGPSVSLVPLVAAVGFAAEASRLLAIAPWRDRLSAIAARSRIAALADAVTSVYAALGPSATAAFDALYGLAARHLSGQIADLAPTVLVELNLSLPSNVLAWRLYGDPSRGRELVDRNRVATPCFMPTRFEAAAV